MKIHSKGFTLAEVLITLGIIGVVAALTIPTLVSNYKQRAWDTAANVFERKLEESLKAMNTQQTLAGYSNTLDFVNELVKHLKIIKICESNNLSDCFAGKVNWDVLDIEKGEKIFEEVDLASFKTAKDIGQKNWDTEIIGIQFANGITGLIAYNPDCKQDPYSNQITGLSCIAIAYDTTGFAKPNVYGKDLRSINAKLAKCAFKAGSTCFGTPFAAESITRTECLELKDSLGINECTSASRPYDNWAGAVKTCGGVDNMPTASDLAKIASYVTGRTITEEQSFGGRNGESINNAFFQKYISLGFTEPLENDWVTGHIWSREEDSSNTSYGRFFHKYNGRFNTSYNYGLRSNNSQAICIIR